MGDSSERFSQGIVESLTGVNINNANTSKGSVILNVTSIVSQAQDITEDYGKICRNLFKGTGIHEDLFKVAREFAQTETHTEKTENMMKEIVRLTDEMEVNRGNMMKSFGSVVRVEEQLEEVLKSFSNLEKYRPNSGK